MFNPASRNPVTCGQVVEKITAHFIILLMLVLLCSNLHTNQRAQIIYPISRSSGGMRTAIKVDEFSLSSGGTRPIHCPDFPPLRPRG